MRVIKKSLIVPVVAFLASIAFLAPASAATNAEIDTARNVGCTIYVDATFYGSGTYRFQVWDDGYMLWDQVLTTKGKASRRTVAYQATAPILQGAAGVGLYITNSNGGVTYDGIGDFDFTGSNLCAPTSTGSGPIDVVGGK